MVSVVLPTARWLAEVLSLCLVLSMICLMHHSPDRAVLSQRLQVSRADCLLDD